MGFGHWDIVTHTGSWVGLENVQSLGRELACCLIFCQGVHHPSCTQDVHKSHFFLDGGAIPTLKS